jgi:5-methylcytosine-specific restriction endonuclease McrA
MQMLQRQKNQCAIWNLRICKKTIDISNSEADHMMEYSNNGLTTINNGQMLCKPCHKEKTKEYKQYLLYTETEGSKIQTKKIIWEWWKLWHSKNLLQ